MSLAQRRSHLWASVGGALLGWSLPCHSQAPAVVAADAASAPAAASDAVQKVTISSTRSSLAAALADKREATGVLDAVHAADVFRLPDLSVTDALQRVTGVQITRDRGEGGVVTVRGLTQVETLLNGREVFSAGTGRQLELSDVPSEMLSHIDVWKTPPVEMIEGGLGGTIDLRTRQPLDSAQDQAALTARVLQGDLVDRAHTQLSGLVVSRWQDDSGEWGLLANLALQDRGFREDSKVTGAPTARTDLLPGQTVVAPGGATETVSSGDRQRRAGSLMLGWQPHQALKLQLEAHWAVLRTRQDSQQVNALASSRFEPGSLELFANGLDLKRITWLDAPLTVLSFARDTVDRSRQFAMNAEGTLKGVSASTDLSHTRSRSTLLFSGPYMAATAPRFSQDLSGRTPATAIAGADFADPGLYRFTGLAYRNRPFEGSLTAWRADAHQRLDLPGWREWQAGIRLARRRADNATGLVFGDTALAGPRGDEQPGLLEAGAGAAGARPGPSLSGFRVGSLEQARDPAALRAAFGIVGPLPNEGNPLGRWRIIETTFSGHLGARWEDASERWRGELGIRWVRTRASVAGQRSDTLQGDTDPVQVEATTTDWLPTLAVRHTAPGGLVWKAAVSGSLTRPNFDQLSPSLTLLPNSIDPRLNQGSAGNPALKPVRSRNLDLAVEHYLDTHTAGHATVFWKWVDGFVNTVSTSELHDGASYQVSRPRNTGRARVSGAELGWQQAFVALPAPWNSLGLLANYTYIDSRSEPDADGRPTSLQNLSRHSANLIGWYERSDWAARVAWNWRGRYLSSQVNVVGVGTLPVYTAGYAWLDASLEHRLTHRVSLRLEGLNLLRTERRAYYGTPTRPQGTWLNDRQVAATVSATW